MGKIILSMCISVVGVAFFFGSQNTGKYVDNSNPLGMIFGGLLQFVAMVVFLMGAKQYFLGDIIKALTEKKQ